MIIRLKRTHGSHDPCTTTPVHQVQAAYQHLLYLLDEEGICEIRPDCSPVSARLRAGRRLSIVPYLLSATQQDMYASITIITLALDFLVACLASGSWESLGVS